MVIGLGAALTVAACSSDDRSEVTSVTPAGDIADGPVPDTTEAAAAPADAPASASSTTDGSSPTEPDTTTAPDAARTAAQINEYVAEAAAFDQAGADAQFPEGLTFAAGGAPGYSRYVFRDNGTDVVPTLVEGPLSGTVRCQDEAAPCSYLELADLSASGDPIPPELGMDGATLAELVGQLDQLNEFADAHQDVNSACADGFVSDRIQTPNMGSHFYRADWIADGFDPARPEILLYALASGQMPDGPIGQCRDGIWDGEPMKLVGTSFIIPPQVIGDDHPETFAGPLDNWHIHYNLCRGNRAGRDSFVPRAECEAQGGNFSPALGWMIHAWVDAAHDNELGVFGMWNSSLAPELDATTIRDIREVRGEDFPDGGQQSLITDFSYTGELSVVPGQTLFFNNVDAVPHTVTSGTPENPELDSFDSGLLTPGSNFGVTFDEPGVYSLFCTLHPDMLATVQVDDDATSDDAGG
jgi:hypothetical protein